LVTKLLPKPIIGNPEIAYKINSSGIEKQRYIKALEMFEDVERLWRRYQFRKNFRYIKCYGLVQKEEPTIVPKWPYRIDTQQDFASVRACFELRRGGMWGGERFVEWKRTTGPTFLELDPKIVGIESVTKEPLLLFGDSVAKHKKGCKVCCCDCAEGKKKGAPSNCDNPRELGIEEPSGVKLNYTLLNPGEVRFDGRSGFKINAPLLARWIYIARKSTKKSMADHRMKSRACNGVNCTSGTGRQHHALQQRKSQLDCEFGGSRKWHICIQFSLCKSKIFAMTATYLYRTHDA
jgi:hypothetical protein